jgi:trimethylamine--corrinoid protein Co-methyltransferase
MLDCGMIMSMGQLVADADVIRMFKRILEGVPVNDLTMALDVIHNVGPAGHFLAEEHTVQNMRKMQSRPRFIDRGTRVDFLNNGSKAMMAKANEEARRILETHHPKVLSDETVARIHSIVEDAEKEFGVKE